MEAGSRWWLPSFLFGVLRLSQLMRTLECYQTQVWTFKVVLLKEVDSIWLKMLNYSEKKRQAKPLILKLSAELFSMSPDVWHPGNQGGHLD